MHVRVSKGIYSRVEVTPKGRELIHYHVGDELAVSDHVYEAYKNRLEPCAPPLRSARAKLRQPAPPAPAAAVSVANALSQEGAGAATEGAGAPADNAAPGVADVGTVTGDGSGSALPPASQEERVAAPVQRPRRRAKAPAAA